MQTTMMVTMIAMTMMVAVMSMTIVALTRGAVHLLRAMVLQLNRGRRRSALGDRRCQDVEAMCQLKRVGH